MRNTSAMRIIRDGCCPVAWIVARAERHFLNAMAKAILDDKWLTITKKHPNSEEN